MTLNPLTKFRFSIKHSKPDSGCWQWFAGFDQRGYGVFNIKSKPQKAHRVSYRIHVGKIPTKAHVLHRCDNPACVNPKHLFLGDQNINMKDMASKNRGANQITGSIKYLKEKYV